MLISDNSRVRKNYFLNIRTSLWDYIVDTLTSNCSVALCSLDSEEFLHVLLGKRLPVMEDEFPVQKDYFTFVKLCTNFVNFAVFTIIPTFQMFNYIPPTRF